MAGLAGDSDLEDAGAELLPSQALQVQRSLSCRVRLAAGLLAALGFAAIELSRATDPQGRPQRTKTTEPIMRYEAAKFAPPPSDDREKCGKIEDDMDFQGLPIATIYNVGSAHMCCSACAAYANCTTWTWGKKRGVEFLTDVCWLSTPESSDGPTRVPKEGVVAGFRSMDVQKYGVAAPPKATAEKVDGLDPAEGAIDSERGTEKCPGSVNIKGYGPVAMVSAGANVPGEPAAKTEVLAETAVIPHMEARVYFAEGESGCSEGDYDPSVYAAINLLGKKISWTTDVSGTNCGCNAAFYLVSMKQNQEISTCNDYYCDAMSVCGVPCGEIDLQEANMFSWLSTLHTHNPEDGPDGLGVGPGFGGSLGVPPRRDWTSEKYGPGSTCIDTQKPFKVEVSFPTDEEGTLTDMQVELTQGDCSLNAGSPFYELTGREPYKELTAMLEEGMTPVISYWNSEDMLWMDGLGLDGFGPCVRDDPGVCPDWVRFWNFEIESL